MTVDIGGGGGGTDGAADDCWGVGAGSVAVETTVVVRGTAVSVTVAVMVSGGAGTRSVEVNESTLDFTSVEVGRGGGTNVVVEVSVGYLGTSDVHGTSLWPGGGALAVDACAEVSVVVHDVLVVLVVQEVLVGGGGEYLGGQSPGGGPSPPGILGG
jgi:hypothetical protein